MTTSSEGLHATEWTKEINKCVPLLNLGLLPNQRQSERGKEMKWDRGGFKSSLLSLMPLSFQAKASFTYRALDQNQLIRPPSEQCTKTLKENQNEKLRPYCLPQDWVKKKKMKEVKIGIRIGLRKKEGETFSQTSDFTECCWLDIFGWWTILHPAVTLQTLLCLIHSYQCKTH